MKRLGVLVLGAFFSLTTMAGDDVLPLKKAVSPSGLSDKTENFKAYGGPNSSTVAPPVPGGGAAAMPTGPEGEMTRAPISAKPYVASLDTFGSSRINEAKIKEFLGADLNAWLDKGLNNDHTAPDLEKKLSERIKAKFGFALAQWSVVQYFQPGDMAIHITLDVVESGDVATRMPFQSEPTGSLPDPDKLIRQWHTYETTALELVEKGEVNPDSEQCVAFHCPFGHKHPKLKRFERIFVEGVKKNEKQLATILTTDHRPDFRGAACYLLAYLKDGNKVVNYELGRIKDPEELVRNNALRVLGDMAELHPEYVIPPRMVIPTLHYPRVSDRSKGVYVVFQLAGGSKDAKEEIIHNAVPDLLALMESKQPDHRDLSYGVLRKISGKDFPIEDLKSWKEWYAKIPDRAITKK
jgi:hypothetical protein